MKKFGFLAIIIIFFFSLSPLSAEETNYTNDSFARLSYFSGNVYIQRASDLGYEEAAVNMPITEGDRVGTTDGRAEIYLGKGKYCRLDNNTKLDFLNMPKKGDDLIQIQIWTGNVYFSISALKKEKNLEIHTSDVSVYILDQGLYRIDVRENSETEIFVYKGLVEAAGESGSVLIKESQRVEAADGAFTSKPSQFFAVAEDSFDRWSENRDTEVRKQLARSYLPDELEDFEYELDAYGEWVYMPPYGYVWVPGGVDANWRPYYWGRWTWLPLSGWTWLPYDPWGWVTFHYGRWQWSIGLDWYWIPTTAWGPGWVSWYWGYDYYGWAPLSYYGYPGVIYNDLYYGRYTGPYPSSSRVLTVIHKNQLKARDISKAALSQESAAQLGKIQLTSTAPPVSPASGRVSVERLEGRQVFLRQNESPEVDWRKTPQLKTSPQKPESINFGSKKFIEETSRGIGSAEKRDILSRRTRYPSSPEISIRKYLDATRSQRSSSPFSRIFEYLSGSKSSRSRFPESSGSSRISSSSRHSSSSSSSSRSSSSSSSSSSGTKTKKKN